MNIHNKTVNLRLCNIVWRNITLVRECREKQFNFIKCALTWNIVITFIHYDTLEDTFYRNYIMKYININEHTQ